MAISRSATAMVPAHRALHFVTGLLLMLFLIACQSSPKFSPNDLLIQPNAALPGSPASLSAEQVKYDVAYLTYALDRAYGGRDFLPEGEARNMLARLNRVNGLMTPEELRDRIDKILADVSDSHLHAKLNGKRSKYRENKRKIGQVGKRIYEGSPGRPWFVELRNIARQKVLVISIAQFPYHESSVWNGFIERVDKLLPKATAAIFDLRGNGGGDDTVGIDLAWLFYGKDFEYPISLTRERQTPETKAIFASSYGLQIAKNRKENKLIEPFLFERYKKKLKEFEEAKSESQAGYKDKVVGLISRTGQYKNPKQFNGSIYILIDARCGSSCESTVDAFETHPTAKLVGENTAGFVHFGNVSPVILPHSRIHVQLPTHYSEYKDKRFIEKKGIAPQVFVKPGDDAYEVSVSLLKTDMRKTDRQ